MCNTTQNSCEIYLQIFTILKLKKTATTGEVAKLIGEDVKKIHQKFSKLEERKYIQTIENTNEKKERGYLYCLTKKGDIVFQLLSANCQILLF